MNYNERRPVRTLSPRSSDAWAAFRSRVEDLGGAVLEPSWKGNRVGHLVRCSEGHEVSPRPDNVQQGRGLCRICAGKDSAAAEAEHRERVIADGGTPLWTEWKGNRVGHLVRCAEGHEASPSPDNVQRGQGICRICAGSSWDVLYVTISHDAVKFGITSGDPRPRLRQHYKAGLNCVAVWPGLPGTVAPDLERELIGLLNEAGVQSVKGREYFPANCLDFIMDVITDRLQPLGG